VQESRLTTLTRRGLMFPTEIREEIRKTGIRCRAQVEIVHQEHAKRWKLRAEESGGAEALLGHYVGFLNTDGTPMSWLQRVQSLLPNGMHAVVIESDLVRVEMFRYEHTYDLLITRHWLEEKGDERPELRNELLYLGRKGTLTTELWGRDAAFCGGAQPTFYTRSGEKSLPSSIWTDAVLKVTEAVCCVGCKHCHLLEPGITTTTGANVVPNEKDSVANNNRQT
jgi:hypothetical protein